MIIFDRHGLPGTHNHRITTGARLGPQIPARDPRSFPPVFADNPSVPHRKKPPKLQNEEFAQTPLSEEASLQD
jgi:hypothetical protein